MNNIESTLVDTINALGKEGYTEDFNLKHDWIEFSDKDHKILYNEFHIDKYFRFEGNTDPADECILYAITSEKYDIKGVLVNGYGISSEVISNEMLEKLK